MGLEEEYANPHLKWVHHGAVQGNAQAIRDWVKWYWSDPDTLHETPDGRLVLSVRGGIGKSVHAGHLDIRDGGNNITSLRISCFPLADAALPTMEKLRDDLLAVFPPVTGSEVQDPHPRTGPPLIEEQYVFRRSGDMWEIAYTDGKGFHLADLKGLHYIAYLLDNQGKEVSALDLEQSHPDSPDDTQAMQISAAQLDENGLATSSTDDRQPVLDEKAKQEYKDKLESLRDDREQAEQLEDDEQLERIDKETDAISRELNSAQDIFGKSRIFANQNERCRKRVTEAIRTSLVKLRTNHKELGEHLGASIKTGGYCSYTSQEEISWNR